MNRFNLLSSFPKQHKQKIKLRVATFFQIRGSNSFKFLRAYLKHGFYFYFSNALRRRIKDRLCMCGARSTIHIVCNTVCIHTLMSPLLNIKLYPDTGPGSVRSGNLIFALEINRENVKSGKINSTSGLITDGLLTSTVNSLPRNIYIGISQQGTMLIMI